MRDLDDLQKKFGICVELECFKEGFELRSIIQKMIESDLTIEDCWLTSLQPQWKFGNLDLDRKSQQQLDFHKQAIGRVVQDVLKDAKKFPEFRAACLESLTVLKDFATNNYAVLSLINQAVLPGVSFQNSNELFQEMHRVTFIDSGFRFHDDLIESKNQSF